MEWDTLIPGHPGPGGKQTGTKENARDELAYLQDLSGAVKKAVSEGKSYADAQRRSSCRNTRLGRTTVRSCP